MDYVVKSESDEIVIEQIKTEDYDTRIKRLTEYLNNDVVDRLVALRKEKKMTQQDIADATGMQRANVARIEGKRNTPSTESLVRYADCLGTSLFMGVGEVPGLIRTAGEKVSIGIQDFSEIRERSVFYVDKTSFIKEWWESGDSATLITRPRRFGKTLNMSMLEHFFSVKHAGRADLFEGLSIWNCEEYRKIQGTYPVISLSFANVKDTEYQTVSYRIRQIISNVYEEHAYLRNSSALSETEKEYFNKVAGELSEEDAPMALNRLTKFLNAHFGKKVILLLDEYDTPMQEAYSNGFWEKLAAFTKVFFNCTFKTNPYLERALMTGITRVSKESFFSDLNHLEVVTMASEKYASAFGFTEKEVWAALDKYGYEKERARIKWWYDGFSVGTNTELYNPWSIINFLQTGRFDSYWTNTSSNALPSMLVREGSTQLKDTFEKLLKEETVSCRLDDQIVFQRLSDSEEAVWSLLAASGYIKIVKNETTGMRKTVDGKYYIKLTNNEVKHTFMTMVRDWFKPADMDYDGFLKALLLGDLKGMNIHMSRLCIQVFSYFDTGKGPFGTEPERFYHGFVLGLLVELQGRYVIHSNRESGFGRYDVMLEPLNRSEPAMILEFKVHDAGEESDLSATVRSALDQIKEKQYTAELVAKGIPQNQIRSYGFAFDGKKVLIGEAK